MPALIPEDYLPDVHTRLIMYKRIASAESTGALDELQVEMIDRFGLLPLTTRTLFKVTAIKLKASPIGIRKIDMSASGGRITFTARPNIDPASVIAMVQREPARYQLDGAHRLRIVSDVPELEQRIELLGDVLDRLGVHSKDPPVEIRT